MLFPIYSCFMKFTLVITVSICLRKGVCSVFLINKSVKCKREKLCFWDFINFKWLTAHAQNKTMSLKRSKFYYENKRRYCKNLMLQCYFKNPHLKCHYHAISIQKDEIIFI